MTTINLSSELKRLLTYVKVLGRYNSLQEALEDSINDYYSYVVREILMKDNNIL